MVTNSRRSKGIRIDLSELEIHTTLLEDLRHYVGSPRLYVPKIWDVCMDVLRYTKRIILNEKDQGELFDDIFDDFLKDFNVSAFNRILQETHISVRREDYKRNVAQFYFDVFMIMYPQVASTVNKLINSDKRNVSFLNYKAKVESVIYDYVESGFGDEPDEREVAVIVTASYENMLTDSRLLETGYDF